MGVSSGSFAARQCKVRVASGKETSLLGIISHELKWKEDRDRLRDGQAHVLNAGAMQVAFDDV